MTQQMNQGHGARADDDRSMSELVNDLSTQISRLVRDELKLAQYELVGKGKRFGVGAGLAGTAGVLAWFGVGTLVATLVLVLALVLPAWVSALIVAVAVLATAGVLALVAKKQVQQAAPPIPEEAAQSVKDDVAAVKGRMHS